MSGTTSYHAGRVAEENVARTYERRGFQIAARRWRGKGGEIDLIARKDGAVVFVEVKHSRSHARAAEHLSARQIERLFHTAAEFLEGEPAGQLTDSRFDVALVDGVGRIELLENALAL